MSGREDQFAAALLDPARPVPEALRDGAARPAGRRFDVYRNNVTVSLIEALETGFPTVARLLGGDNMKGLARLYLRANPPESPLMMHYGSGFPEFLASRKDLAHLGYLPDMARLDLALRRSYHAADVAPVDAAVLSEMPPDLLMQARVTLAPALELLRSDWPVHDIWRFATQDGAPKPRAEAQDVVILRPEYDPIPQLLPAGGATWIAALGQGLSFGAAFDAAQAEAAAFDLSASLALLLQGGALTSLTTDQKTS